MVYAPRPTKSRTSYREETYAPPPPPQEPREPTSYLGVAGLIAFVLLLFATGGAILIPFLAIGGLYFLLKILKYLIASMFVPRTQVGVSGNPPTPPLSTTYAGSSGGRGLHIGWFILLAIVGALVLMKIGIPPIVSIGVSGAGSVFLWFKFGRGI